MIGSTEASIGIIRRYRSESGDLGYTFDFDAKTGFFPDDSTNCVSDNFECFKFLRSYQILRNGVTKTLIRTHETEQHALFNGVTSSSTINWDGFCLKSDAGVREDDIFSVGANVKHKVRGGVRRSFLVILEGSVQADGNITEPMAGFHQTGQVTIALWSSLHAVVAMDPHHPSTAQQKNAIVAILARQKDLPSKAEAMQQRRESTKRKVAQQQQQQLLQQEQQSRPKVLKPPSVQTKVGAKPPSDKIQVISDDEDPESPAGLSDDIDILIPIAKRSSRQIFKLPPDVIIKAARMLRLDNGGATTKLTSLRAKVKDYFSRGSSVLDTYNSEDSFSFTDNSPSSSPLQPAAARSAWMPPPLQARPACMPPPPPPSMPPPPPPEVPSSPWKTFTDPLGKPYFYNTNTSESTWDPPGIFSAPPPPPPPPPPEVLSNQWTQHTDARGTSYWHNVTTSESTWVRPVISSALKAHSNSESERLNTVQLLPTKRAHVDTRGYQEPHYSNPGSNGTPRAALYQGAAEERERYEVHARNGALERAEASERAEGRDARERAEAREARERTEAREARERAEAREARDRAASRERAEARERLRDFRF